MGSRHLENSWQKYKMINKDHLKILKNKNKKKLLISAGQDNLRTLILDYFNLQINSSMVDMDFSL